MQCIRRGFRSVPLRNGYSEPLEMAALLVHLAIHKRNVLIISFIVTDSSINLTILSQDEASAILHHREQLRELRTRIAEAEQSGDEAAAQEARTRVRVIENDMLQAFIESKQRT